LAEVEPGTHFESRRRCNGQHLAPEAFCDEVEAKVCSCHTEIASNEVITAITTTPITAVGSTDELAASPHRAHARPNPAECSILTRQAFLSHSILVNTAGAFAEVCEYTEIYSRLRMLQFDCYGVSERRLAVVRLWPGTTQTLPESQRRHVWRQHTEGLAQRLCSCMRAEGAKYALVVVTRSIP